MMFPLKLHTILWDIGAWRRVYMCQCRGHNFSDYRLFIILINDDVWLQGQIWIKLKIDITTITIWNFRREDISQLGKSQCGDPFGVRAS